MRRVLTVVNAFALQLALAATARAQAAMPMSHSYDNPEEHARAFTSGSPHGWTVGAPHLDIAGGYFHVGGAGGYGSNTGSSAAFFRVHAQFAVASPVIQIASDIQFLPKFTGANPTISAVAQLAPLKPGSALYLAGGIGIISGHDADRFSGWLQATAAIRTPIHSVALFGQIGKSLRSGSKGELLLGVQHSLAPYRLHGLKG